MFHKVETIKFLNKEEHSKMLKIKSNAVIDY